MSTPVLTAETDASAQAGVFLSQNSRLRVESIPRHVESADGFSDLFWASRRDEYCDLLQEDVGNLLQTGIDEEGGLVPLTSEQKTGNLSLIFDARERKAGKYLWQLTVTNSKGRDVYQLSIADSTSSFGHYRHDHQGALREARLGDDSEAADFLEIIKGLVNHDVFKQKEAEIIARKKEAQGNWFSYVHNGRREAGTIGSAEYYERQVLHRKGLYEMVGFTALTPQTYEIPPAPTARVEDIAQDPLSADSAA